ncbi:MAG TPA: hypothetical protein DEO39_02465 [Clostridiales bacterium]|nr:hypothetical protein [Clostridiales bacterium]
MLKDFFNIWSILRVATYYFFFMLLFWGSSSKLGKKDFHKDFCSLDMMKSLRGFAAIGVILHHISQEEAFQRSRVLSPFVNAGAFFVAIFFFCSGYGLLKSLNTKENYLKGFIRNRIVKSILLPFYVNVILYAIYYAFVVKVKWPAAQWICNFTGLTMMNPYAWFPVVLAILYLVFFLTFRFIKNRPVCFTIIGLVIIGMGIGFCFNGHMAWWHGPKNWWLSGTKVPWWCEQKILWFNGEWWVNSAIAFLSGLLFAQFETAIVSRFRRLYALKFHIVLLLTYLAYLLSNYGQTAFGYWTEYSGKGPGIENKIRTYFCQLPLFALLGFLIIIFMMKYHVDNPVTRFFGKFSLDTYLMNLMALEISRFLMDNRKFPFKVQKYNLLNFVFTTFVLTILLGVIEKYITDGIKKLLFRKKDTEKQLAADKA